MRTILLTSFALLACGQQRSTTATTPVTRFGSDKDATFFTLERTPCFGKCPAYIITIKADGSATYDGRRFAEREGLYSGQVSTATMQQLLDRAKTIGFFDMQDRYDGQVTDLPSTIIRVNADGKDKKVIARYKEPNTFRPFAAYADTLLSSVKWAPAKSGDH